MTAWEIIKEATRTKLFAEEGVPEQWTALPGLDEAGIERLARELGFSLPRELRELLVQCSGVEGALETLDFTGALDFEFEAAFPSGLPIGHDGFGNFWVLDVTSTDTEVAPIFFVCHDPPICLFQSTSIADFMRELVRMHQPPFRSDVDDVHEDRLFHVWKENPGTLTVEEAAADDGALANFSSGLESGFTVVDLRKAPVGMGFSWGRYGSKTVVRRHGQERLFAYGRGGSPRQGLLGRLFG